MDHLILFFDINGTIVALDSAQEKTLEITLLQELAKHYIARWDKSLVEPIPYTKFVRRYLLRGEENTDLNLKRQRQHKYAHFLAYLSEYHPKIYEDVSADLAHLQDRLSGSPGHLFPSFLKLLLQLKEQKIPFTLVLRSFGNDIPTVKRELAAHGVIIQDIGYFKGPHLYLKGQQLSDPLQIVQSVRTGQHQAWKDDWAYWHTHKHREAYGKPFYLSEKQPLSLFFDDKAIEKEILHIKRLDGREMTREAALASQHLFAVDTLQAIRDENYFCDRVFSALKRR